MEALRQERETFDQNKCHEARWFTLRLVMGYLSIPLMGVIIFISYFVLSHQKEFSGEVVAMATAALFVDVLGILTGVWKIVINPDFHTKLTPVTHVTLPSPQGEVHFGQPASNVIRGTESNAQGSDAPSGQSRGATE